MPELQAVGWDSFFEAHWSGVTRPEWTPGRIAAEHRGRFECWTAAGVREARLAGRLKRQLRGEERPSVGDWVGLRDEGNLATVEHVFPRRSAFVRKAAGDRDEAQVVAANVDTVFFVVDLAEDFNVRRAERFLAQLFESGAQPVVILNKADLCETAQAKADELRTRARSAPVHVASAVAGDGVSELRRYVDHGRTVALVGASGAGKSSLANALAGGSVMRVAELARDGRGQHTTTHRQIIALPAGGLLLDTPGMRELGLWGEGGVDEAFDDIAALAPYCRFSDCQHGNEPGCAATAAVESGELDGSRLEHFRRLRDEASRRAKRVNGPGGRPPRKPVEPRLR